MTIPNENTDQRLFFGSNALDTLINLVENSTNIFLAYEKSSLSSRSLLAQTRKILEGKHCTDLPVSLSAGEALPQASREDLILILGTAQFAEAVLPQLGNPGDESGPDLGMILAGPFQSRTLKAMEDRKLFCIADPAASAGLNAKRFAQAYWQLIQDLFGALLFTEPKDSDDREGLAQSLEFLCNDGLALILDQSTESRAKLLSTSWEIASQTSRFRSWVHDLLDLVPRILSRILGKDSGSMAALSLWAALESQDNPKGKELLELANRLWKLQWGDERVRRDEGIARLGFLIQSIGLETRGRDLQISQAAWEKALDEVFAAPEVLALALPFPEMELFKASLAGRY